MMRIRSFAVLTNVLDEVAANHSNEGVSLASCSHPQTEETPEETTPESSDADSFLPAA